MFYGIPYPFGFDASALNRYKAWWWALLLRRKRAASSDTPAETPAGA